MLSREFDGIFAFQSDAITAKTASAAVASTELEMTKKRQKKLNGRKKVK